MPRTPRQSLFAVFASIGALCALASGLQIFVLDPPMPDHEIPLGWPHLVFVLGLLSLHTFALLAHIRIKATPQALSGGWPLRVALCAVALFWGWLIVVMAVSIVC